MKMIRTIAAVALWLAGLAEALAAPAETNRPLSLNLELVDGSRLVGTPAATSVVIQTTYATMEVAWQRLQAIKVEAGAKSATFTFANGDTLNGTPKFGAIELQTAFGKVRVAPEQIRSILISAGLSTTYGLLRHYSFNGAEGKAEDDSPNKQPGTVHGAKYVKNGRGGGAFEFNGRDDFIDCGNVEGYGGSLTISAWVKHAPASDWDDLLIGPDGGVLLAFCRDMLVFATQGGSGPFTLQQPAANIDDGAWHHLCATYDGKMARLYVDGKPGAAVDGRGPYNEGRLCIGADPRHPNEAFRGMLDEVMIFNRPLSAAEVELLFRTQSNP
jgi:hypothetical protein